MSRPDPTDLYTYLASDPKAKAAYEAIHGKGSSAYVMRAAEGEMSPQEVAQAQRTSSFTAADLDAMSDEEYAKHRRDILKSAELNR